MFILLFPFLSLAEPSLSEPSLSLMRLRDLLYQVQPDQKVRYRDDLGEGPGSFDFDPRIDWSHVNCTTWWQQLIAKSYAKNDKEELEILDRIRYYDGVVGFSTRKHFLDRAFLLDPQPFQNIAELDIPTCAPDVERRVVLDLDRFTEGRKFSCPLYRPDVYDMTFQYFSPNALLDCVPQLPSGVYMIIPAASIRYNEVWGKSSGPMGRVHGLILDKDGSYTQVHHASIEEKKVLSLPLRTYVESLAAALFDGYQVYRLLPSFGEAKPVRAHEQAISCERETYIRNAAPIE